jgi:hypothetical protein
VTDLEAIDQTLCDYYFSQAMDSVRDLLDGCVDGGRYVAPERRSIEPAADGGYLLPPQLPSRPGRGGASHHWVIIDEVLRFRQLLLAGHQARDVRGVAD